MQKLADEMAEQNHLMMSRAETFGSHRRGYVYLHIRMPHFVLCGVCVFFFCFLRIPYLDTGRKVCLLRRIWP